MIAARPIPLAELREELYRLYAPPRRSPRTWAKVRRALDELARVGAETTADLTARSVAELLRSRPAGERPATTRTLLACVRVICGYAADEGYAPPSPFLGRPVAEWLPRAPAAPTDPAESPDAPAIAAALAELAAGAVDGFRAHRLFALAATVAHTGIRYREGLTLRHDRIDLPRRLLFVADRRWGDTPERARPVPIAPPLAEVLRPYLAARGRRRPWSPFAFPSLRGDGQWSGGDWPRTATEMLRRTGERIGVPGLTFLALRRSWAHLAATRWEVPADVAAAILGAGHPRDRRRNRAPELVRAAARIRFDAGGAAPR